MRNRFLVFIILLLVTGFVLGCGKAYNPASNNGSSDNPVSNPANPPANNPTPSQKLTSIIVTPSSAAIEAGKTQQFSASGYFESQSEAKTITPTWEVIGSIGTIDATGLFTATTIGTGAIKAIYSNVTSQSTVEVLPRTISGYVYDGSSANIFNANLIPIEGASVYIGDKMVASKTDGSFSFSDVSLGDVAITATKEKYNPRTIVVEKSRVKIFLPPKNSSNSKGTATFTGLVKGLPASYTMSSYGYILSNYTYYGSNFSFDDAASVYSISEGPDSGSSYVVLDCHLNSEYVYTFKKVNASGGTNNVDLEFGSNRIDCKITPPAGFKTSQIAVELAENNLFPYFSIYTNSLNGETAYSINKLPQLNQGESYSVYARAKNTSGEDIEKHVHGLNSGSSVDIDMSAMSEYKLINPTPADGAVLSSYPTIAWNPISDGNIVYQINIWAWESGSGESFFWSALTKGNSIQVPKALAFKSGVEYNISASPASIAGFDIADISTLRTSTINAVWRVPVRTFYFGAKTASVKSLAVSESRKMPNFWENLFNLSPPDVNRK